MRHYFMAVILWVTLGFAGVEFAAHITPPSKIPMSGVTLLLIGGPVAMVFMGVLWLGTSFHDPCVMNCE